MNNRATGARATSLIWTRRNETVDKHETENHMTVPYGLGETHVALYEPRCSPVLQTAGVRPQQQARITR
uniref:Uncharacterized protein n=1 Tax=Arundo donax TaxID=35708 RepID=A0A0A8YN22_ARUDO